MQVRQLKKSTEFKLDTNVLNLETFREIAKSCELQCTVFDKSTDVVYIYKKKVHSTKQHDNRMSKLFEALGIKPLNGEMPKKAIEPEIKSVVNDNIKNGSESITLFLDSVLTKGIINEYAIIKTQKGSRMNVIWANGVGGIYSTNNAEQLITSALKSAFVGGGNGRYASKGIDTTNALIEAFGVSVVLEAIEDYMTHLEDVEREKLGSRSDLVNLFYKLFYEV